MKLDNEHGHLLRRPFLTALMQSRSDALVVCGLGSATYDMAAADDRPENFYYWGGMGVAAMTGLGLALAEPHRRVLVVTGDGEMLMGVGSFATIAAQAPKNLAILVLDNESFGETGMQDGLTGGRADLAIMAQGAGIEKVATVRHADDLATVHELAFDVPGPTVCIAKVALTEDARVLPTRDGALIARRFREALGHTV